MVVLYFLLLLLAISTCAFKHSRDTNSPEFQLRAAQMYEKVLPCLLSAPIANKSVTYKFPTDAEEHFLELKEKTRWLLNVSYFEFTGYQGPWVENKFIDKFYNFSLNQFHGFIPLFVPFFDHCTSPDGIGPDRLDAALRPLLRPTVMYLAISEGDWGLMALGKAFPNILSLSSGGWGHIIIPEIKGELPATPLPEKFDQDFGFFGTVMQNHRPHVLSVVSGEAARLGMTYRQDRGPNWVKNMQQTKYTLAPRGNGRSSYRFAESIQIGRMPILFYNDVPWVPYLGTNISVETFGFMSNDDANNIRATIQKVHDMTPDEFSDKMRQLRQVRVHFTYEGVLEQVRLFMHDPFGPYGGYLRCTQMPESMHRW